ncbi:hypothetical protein [Limnofasciculus baicalensis]|uniref:Uncharacterized protein n=1 Tax=Limnofasciculus baicalensis BBK-W-15 TaxID=2699891 RepID=A0AAE3GXU9_9CYAN|nr:hypothetical protein [Limnofasciculus baicalensis]MCP2731811.1 hypothetical protein [Limnofasciculus baicalensis BBK-W-15]
MRLFPSHSTSDRIDLRSPYRHIAILRSQKPNIILPYHPLSVAISLNPRLFAAIPLY